MSSVPSILKIPDPDLTKIPNIMYKQGWNVAGRLMSRWLSSTAIQHPRRAPPDTSTVTMGWALKIERAKNAYADMIANKVWMTAKARAEIVKLLSSRNQFQSKVVRFGNLKQTVPVLDKEYIQLAAVGSLLPLFDPLDDMYAALGRFTFRVAVEGKTTPLKPVGHEISIEKVGIYIHDTYDFEGNNPLGYWDLDKGTVGKTPFSGMLLRDSTFATWRTRHGYGGDFYIYSDLKTTAINPPDTFKTML